MTDAVPTVPPSTISFVRASSMVRAPAVCHTVTTLGVSDVLPIQPNSRTSYWIWPMPSA